MAPSPASLTATTLASTSLDRRRLIWRSTMTGSEICIQSIQAKKNSRLFLEINIFGLNLQGHQDPRQGWRDALFRRWGTVQGIRGRDREKNKYTALSLPIKTKSGFLNNNNNNIQYREVFGDGEVDSGAYDRFNRGLQKLGRHLEKTGEEKEKKEI